MGRRKEGYKTPFQAPDLASCFSLFSTACPVPEAAALLREAEVTCKALLSSFLLKKK